MFPLSDEKIRDAKPSFVTWLFLLLNVGVFIYELGMTEPQLQQFFLTYGTIPQEITHGTDLWTLVTSMFLHGGWMHIIGNMLFLWVFGDNIEHVLGHAGFFLFYMVGGLAASLAHVLAGPESAIPSLGASGAISAVLGAYLVMFPRARITTLVPFGFVFVTRIPAIFFLGIWAAQQFISGIADLGARAVETGGVAWWAHIGGFVFGVVIGIIFRGRAAQVEYIVKEDYNSRRPTGRFPFR